MYAKIDQTAIKLPVIFAHYPAVLDFLPQGTAAHISVFTVFKRRTAYNVAERIVKKCCVHIAYQLRYLRNGLVGIDQQPAAGVNADLFEILRKCYARLLLKALAHVRRAVLPGWVFVEWSRANDADLVCGVNYPSNMLYSGALEAAGRLYGDQAMIDKAYALRQTVRKYGFNGQFFVDNSVRKDGKLVQTANTTEVCQYYAFFFHVADGESYPELKNIVLNGFGAHRKIKNDYPNVPFANAFIGNYMRMMILMKMGEYMQVLKDIRDYFGFMAEKTGSLWEYDTPRASCCHGFASYVALWLTELKEKLGL